VIVPAPSVQNEGQFRKGLVHLWRSESRKIFLVVRLNISIEEPSVADDEERQLQSPTGARCNRAIVVGRSDCSLIEWYPPPLKSDRQKRNPFRRRALPPRHRGEGVYASCKIYFPAEFFSINFWSATCCSGVVTYGCSWERSSTRCPL